MYGEHSGYKWFKSNNIQLRLRQATSGVVMYGGAGCGCIKVM